MNQRHLATLGGAACPRTIPTLLFLIIVPRPWSPAFHSCYVKIKGCSKARGKRGTFERSPGWNFRLTWDGAVSASSSSFSTPRLALDLTLPRDPPPHPPPESKQWHSFSAQELQFKWECIIASILLSQLEGTASCRNLPLDRVGYRHKDVAFTSVYSNNRRSSCPSILRPSGL